jgi:Tol biopolymer transport system component
VSCALLASLPGCGGGGSSQSTTPPQPTNVLAYLHRTGENLIYEITVLKSDGTTTNVGSNNSYISVVLAPNGQQVLFSYYDGTGYSIATMNVDGSGQTALAGGLYPQYTPDGSKIVYQYSGLSMMNADGSNQTVIANVNGEDFCFPATNGSIIAVGMYGAGPQGLATMNMDGSNPQVIVGTDYPVYPVFSADGTQIIFSSANGSSQNIYSVSTTGSNPVQLTNSAENWDPFVAGSKIYFDYIPTSIQNPTTDSNQIYSMALDGSNLTAVTNDNLYDGFKTWNGLCVNP